MKKTSSIYAAALAGALALGLLLAGCEHGGGGPPVPVPQTGTDNPSQGLMSAATANNVFDWAPVTGGAQINKFKDAAALGTYLNTSATPTPSIVFGSVSKFAVMRDIGTAATTFRISQIAGLPVISIASGAFTPVPANEGKDDISNVVNTFVLPETITQLGNNIFADVAKAITVAIPPAVAQAVIGASPGNAAALQGVLGGDVAIAVATGNEQDIASATPIPPANPSVSGVATSWDTNTNTLTATFTYSATANGVTFSGTGWTKTSDTMATYTGSKDVSPVALTYTINGKAKTLQVSLADGTTLARGTTTTYQLYGFDAANNAVGLKEATVTGDVSVGTVSITVNGDTTWKYLPNTGTADGAHIKGIFDAIYAPNAPGSTDGFVAGEAGKTAVTYTDAITEKVLRLFYVTLGSNTNGTDDKIYISGTELPPNTTGASDGSKLIIIDIGRPGGATGNASLPTFYIPHQGLGLEANTVGYPYIRFRVNGGANAVILADNSNFTGTQPCATGYFNNGTFEVWAGGKLRDGAYQGFPLGTNSIILNRQGSYLAVGPESAFSATDDFKWWSGWLIGPAADSPRIAWDSGNSAVKYIEVRPTQLAINANVTVRKNVGLIYSVWFVGNSTVTIDVTDANATPSFSGGKGLKVNDTASTKYEFYGNAGASIIVKAGSSIDKNALESNSTGTSSVWFTATADTTITPVPTGTPGYYVNASSNISGYNNWTGYEEE